VRAPQCGCAAVRERGVFISADEQRSVEADEHAVDTSVADDALEVKVGMIGFEGFRAGATGGVEVHVERDIRE